MTYYYTYEGQHHEHYVEYQVEYPENEVLYEEPVYDYTFEELPSRTHYKNYSCYRNSRTLSPDQIYYLQKSFAPIYSSQKRTNHSRLYVKLHEECTTRSQQHDLWQDEADFLREEDRLAEDENEYESNRFDLARFERTGFEPTAIQGAVYEATRCEENGFESTEFQGSECEPIRCEERGFQFIRSPEHGFESTRFQGNGYEFTSREKTRFEVTRCEETGFENTRCEETEVEATKFQENGYESSRRRETGFEANRFQRNEFESTGREENGFVAARYKGTRLDTKKFEEFQHEESGCGGAGFERAALAATGLEAATLEATTLEATRLEATGLEANGLKSSGLEATGLKSTGLETTGLKSTELEATELKSTGLEATELKSTGHEATGLQSTGLEATGLEATGLKPTGLEATELQSTGLEGTRFEATGPKAAGFKATGVKPIGFQASGFKETKFEATVFEVCGFESSNGPGSIYVENVSDDCFDSEKTVCDIKLKRRKRRTSLRWSTNRMLKKNQRKLKKPNYTKISVRVIQDENNIDGKKHSDISTDVEGKQDFVAKETPVVKETSTHNVCHKVPDDTKFLVNHKSSSVVVDMQNKRDKTTSSPICQLQEPEMSSASTSGRETQTKFHSVSNVRSIAEGTTTSGEMIGWRKDSMPDSTTESSSLRLSAASNEVKHFTGTLSSDCCTNITINSDEYKEFLRQINRIPQMSRESPSNLEVERQNSTLSVNELTPPVGIGTILKSFYDSTNTSTNTKTPNVALTKKTTVDFRAEPVKNKLCRRKLRKPYTERNQVEKSYEDLIKINPLSEVPLIHIFKWAMPSEQAYNHKKKSLEHKMGQNNSVLYKMLRFFVMIIDKFQSITYRYALRYILFI